MATKKSYPLLDKVGETEPIFCLRAGDKLAPIVVDLWVAIARLHGVNSVKTTEAEGVARLMRIWAAQNGAKLPD